MKNEKKTISGNEQKKKVTRPMTREEFESENDQVIRPAADAPKRSYKDNFDYIRGDDEWGDKWLLLKEKKQFFIKLKKNF